MLKLKEWLEKPSFGLMTIGLFLLMEGIGLYTQYVLGFSPCSNCVLIRAYLTLIAFSGIVSLTASLMKLSNKIHKLISVIMSYALGTAGSVLALVYSYDNYLIESGKKFGSCELNSPFPDYLPLDQWLPSVFKLEGLCGTPSPLFSWLSFTELSIIGLPIIILLSSILFLNYLFVFFFKQSK